MSTWILSCDAGSARIFTGPLRAEGDWALVAHVDNPAGRAHTSELVSDQHGQVRQSDTGTNAGVAAPTDPSDHEAERFARDLAERLHRAHASQDFRELVLVTPPRFLGRLRGHLRDDVRAAITVTLRLDLEKLDARELEAKVRKGVVAALDG